MEWVYRTLERRAGAVRRGADGTRVQGSVQGGARVPSMKTVDLKVRPIYHRRADRVRAHVLLCMLAYYVE